MRKFENLNASLSTGKVALEKSSGHAKVVPSWGWLVQKRMAEFQKYPSRFIIPMSFAALLEVFYASVQSRDITVYITSIDLLNARTLKVK